jgi:hypothetical protein
MNAQFTVAFEGGTGHGIYNYEPTLPDPTTDPITEEKLRAVGGNAFALHLGFAPADAKTSYGIRIQYLSRGYQHVYTDHSQSFVQLQNELASEVQFLDILPSLAYNIGRQLSFGGGPYYSIALSEKNTFSDFNPNQRLHRLDYGVHLNGRFSIGRFYLWTQYQHSMQRFDLSAFSATFPDVRPIQNPSPVSIFVVGVGFQLIR